MRLTDELKGNSAAISSRLQLGHEVNQCVAPLTLVSGAFSAQSFPRECICLPSAQHHDYNHIRLHETQDRGTCFLLPSVGRFPSSPWFKFKTPLISSSLCSLYPTPEVSAEWKPIYKWFDYSSASITNMIPGWDWFFCAVTRVCRYRGWCRVSITCLFYCLSQCVINHFYDLYLLHSILSQHSD